MKFTKMHGIGNDYVYVDAFGERVDDPAAVARRVADRHFGVGGDGLILIGPSDRADVRMRMFNADGSESEMCGNGVRCVAKYAYDHGLSKSNPMRIETGRGVLTLALKAVEGKVREVTVNMGEPILEAEKIPTTLPGPRVLDLLLGGAAQPAGIAARRVTTCSFCGKSSRDVGPMVEGPSDVYICLNCVDLAVRIVADMSRPDPAKPMVSRPQTTCSFCGKRSVDVGPMVEGPADVYICAKCVEVAHGIAEGERQKHAMSHPLLATSGAPDWAEASGLDLRITCVSMGNPHVVMYCKDVSKVPLATVGPVMENWEKFPRRINVHFVQVHSPTEVTMRTWERGSGITLACGTGACAVCVAGVLTGRTGRHLLAHLPGGNLTLEWRESDGCVYMTGPATEVFSGEWNG